MSIYVIDYLTGYYQDSSYYEKDKEGIQECDEGLEKLDVADYDESGSDGK